MDKSKATAEKILEAAVTIVNDHTISGTRMHLIAEEAGVSQGNLHYHFNTKRELLMNLLTYTQEDYYGKRKAALEDAEETLEAQLAAFFKQKVKLICDQPEYDRIQIDFWVQGNIDEDFNKAFFSSTDSWREHIEGIIKKYKPEFSEKYVNLVSSIMISMMFGATIQYLNNPEVFDLDEYFDLCHKAIMALVALAE
ncbi:MAG: TetR/AcrR family transcriptional regulator [Eubacteriales bacterium]|nr:TetR/AcrR family transcriptional regulator [Eubacteriales bacterium]